MRKIIDAVIAFIASIVLTLFASPFLVEYCGAYATALLEILFLAVPVLICLLKHEDIKERFSLKLPSVRDFGAALLVFFGINFISTEASLLITQFTGLSNETDSVFLGSYFSDTSPFVALIIVAIIPALCEELLFRGYILNSFKTKKSAVILPIAISSVFFSIAHFDLFKTIPILILGIGFGIIAVLSDSILLTVIGHFYTNAMSLVYFYEAKKYASQGTSTLGINLGNTATVCICTIGIIFGLLLTVAGVAVFKKKKLKGCLVGIIAVIMIIFSIIMLIIAGKSELSEKLTYSDTQTIHETTVITKDFELDKNTVCIPLVTAYGEKETTRCLISIKNENGETVFEGESALFGSYALVEKGKYTLEVKFELKDGDKDEQRIDVDVNILTFAEFYTEKSTEEKAELS